MMNRQLLHLWMRIWSRMDRLVHKWQEKSLMHQSFLYIQPTTLPNVFRVDFEETLIGEYLQFAV